jgi:hypothetical protein
LGGTAFADVLLGGRSRIDQKSFIDSRCAERLRKRGKTSEKTSEPQNGQKQSTPPQLDDGLSDSLAATGRPLRIRVLCTIATRRGREPRALAASRPLLTSLAHSTRSIRSLPTFDLTRNDILRIMAIIASASASPRRPPQPLGGLALRSPDRAAHVTSRSNVFFPNLSSTSTRHS